MAELTYRIHLAAEMSGISPELIRAWERRYGVVKPRRSPGGFRAYSLQDIEILKKLRQLTEEGVSIAEAVRALPEIRRELREQEARGGAASPAQDASRIEAWRTAMLAAAEKYDQLAIELALDEVMGALAPVVAYREVIVPVQIESGDRWLRGQLGIAGEHLLTQAIRTRLLAIIHGARRRARRHVVCACLPDEDHEIGLLGVALRLREVGARVTYLGARTPADQLGEVVRGLRPSAVAVSAVVDRGPEKLRRALADSIAAMPDGTRLFVGGAAAEKHPEVCAELGSALVRDDSDWAELIG